MPRQPTKISPPNAQLLRRSANVKAMLDQRPPNQIKIKMPTSLRKLRNQRRRPLPPLEPRLRNNILAPRKRSLMPLAPLHPPPQNRLQPQRRLAPQHRLELWNPMLSTPPQPSPANKIARTAAMAATPTQHTSIKKLKRPRSATASRTKKKTPRPPVRKLLQTQPNLNLTTGNHNHNPLHLSRNRASRPQSQNTNRRQGVLKNLRHHETTTRLQSRPKHKQRRSSQPSPQNHTCQPSPQIAKRLSEKHARAAETDHDSNVPPNTNVSAAPPSSYKQGAM
jgi:hypothetical protein